MIARVERCLSGEVDLMRRWKALLVAIALTALFVMGGCGEGGEEQENGGRGGGETGGGWVVEEGKRVDDPYFFDVCVVRLEDGTYRMYGEKGGDVESYVSADGLTWQKEEGIRLEGAAFPFVLRLQDGRFRMFYVPSSKSRTPQNKVVSAISEDGITFEREEGARYTGSSEEEQRLQAPRVITAGNGGYRMYFTALIGPPESELAVTLSAFASDGVNFVREEGIRLDPREPPLVGGRAAHAYPLEHAGGVRLYFAGAHAQGGGGILSAESRDGVVFTVNPFPEIAEKERGLGPQDPCVVPAPGGLRMYYGIYRGPEVVEESAIYSAFREDG